jgi:hypothetical protein
MSTPENQQAYAQGYHVGYQHGMQAAQGGGGGGGPTAPAVGYPVNLFARRPDRSNRWLMFFWFIRPFLLIPHFIVLWFLGIGAMFVMIAAWFAVVITGEYPAALHEYLTGVMRWGTRCNAYVMCLTDEYPPFSLN